MQKRWNIRKYNDELRRKIYELSNILNIKPLTAALLINRGIDEEEKARTFLFPKIDDLHDPFLLKDADKATARILKAISRREKVLIWGDYDVDGTTGTVLLRKALKYLGLDVDFHIPHRIHDGYGIRRDRLEQIKKDGYTLVISTDTGSTALEAGQWANENGLDLIVTDHHKLDKDQERPFFALVNPNQHDCPYPNKHLAGVGVAFKIAQAVLSRANYAQKSKVISELLELTALGTIADIMELAGENRTIVALGLQNLSDTRQVGLRALMEIAGCLDEIDSYRVGFQIAPRINAAGRLADASEVIELFETESYEKALNLARGLDTKNRERQKLQETAVNEAIRMVEKEKQNNKVLVVASPDWHRGIVGLVAARLVERFYRPSVAISISEGVAYGSARSPDWFDISEGLAACADVLTKWGGHSKAAGFTLPEKDICSLESIINAYALRRFAEELFVPTIEIEAAVKFSTIDFQLYVELRKMEPFGLGNPRPLFVTRSVHLADKPYVLKDKHLKLVLRDADGYKHWAIWWNGVEKLEEKGIDVCELESSAIDVAYRLDTRDFGSQIKIQLLIEDIRIS